mmetsp:Transcript_20092/g.32954  ORF Transcript_20092/g.32954 Transcript_20092/m.32954 type:complete len:305 (-) Transcript_20092:97-1011(-)
MAEAAVFTLRRDATKNKWKSIVLRALQKKHCGRSFFRLDHLARSYSFNLIPSSKVDSREIAEEFAEGYCWLNYTFGEGFEAFVRQRDRGLVCLEDLAQASESGIDNTGNVNLWSEEVLAYYVLTHAAQFRGKTCCELGAGMTGLGGIAAVSVGASEVLITDGNPLAVLSIHRCIEKNPLLQSSKTSAKVLKWGQEEDIIGLEPFEIIIASDCLYIPELHLELLKVLDRLLKDVGTAVFIGARRSPSLESFVFAAESRGTFKVEVTEEIDQIVSKRYEEMKSQSNGAVQDITHKPILVTLSRTFR